MSEENQNGIWTGAKHEVPEYDADGRRIITSHRDNPKSFGDQAMPTPKPTHIGMDGKGIVLPDRDGDKLHEESGHTTSGRLYGVHEDEKGKASRDFADCLPRMSTPEDCRRVGLSPYWSHLTRRKVLDVKHHDNRDDGRVYMDAGSDIWEPCVDNLDYGIGCAMIDIMNRGQFNKKEFTDFMHENFQLRGVSAIMEILMKWYHMNHGSQLVCELDVTNDMSHTDVEDVSLSDIPFPADSIEFFFADTKIPTILVFKGAIGDIVRRIGIDDVFSEETNERDSLNFWIETRSGAGFMFRANETNWNELMSSDVDDQQVMINSTAFSQAEWDSIRPAFMMVIKVLIYASIPHHTVETIGTKKRHYPLGGKPGIRNRPTRPSKRIVYLPEIRKERAYEEEGTLKHEFRGRRGHLRFYKHKRFKKSGLQNTWAFIPPVRGPNGEMPKAVFRVRKPKIAPRRGAA